MTPVEYVKFAVVSSSLLSLFRSFPLPPSQYSFVAALMANILLHISSLNHGLNGFENFLWLPLSSMVSGVFDIQSCLLVVHFYLNYSSFLLSPGEDP